MARNYPGIYPRTTEKGERRWDVSFDYYDAQGKRRQFMRTFMTLKDARAAKTEHDAKKGKGVDTKPCKATFGECAAAWLAAYGPHVSEGSLATYEGTLRRHILPDLGRVPVGRLSLARLEQHYADLAARGVSAGLIRNVHTLCRQILRWGVLHDYSIDATALRARPPRYERKEMTCWSDGDMARFLAAAKEGTYAALWRTALLTGMRRGELMGLEWADIDWDEHKITVRRCRSVVVNRIVVGPTKNRQTRVLDVPPKLLDVLREHRKQQLARRLRHKGEWPEPELVFTTREGTTVQPKCLRNDLAAILDRAGLEHVRIHDLRHTHASWMFRHGRSVPEVSRRLGHKNAAQTLNVYAHCIPEQHKATAELLGQMFG